MFNRVTYVELITHEHCFKAKVYSTGQRLLELLNDTITDYLDVHEVEVHRYNSPQESVATHAQGIISKADLHLAIIMREEQDATSQRLFAFVQKRKYAVSLTVPGYEVSGNLHLTAVNVSQPIEVLAHHTSAFFPLTQAVVSQAWTGRQIFECPAVMVNKSSLSLFCLNSEPL